MTHLKFKIAKIYSSFLEDRVGFCLLQLCYLLGFALFVTMPIFTFRSGLNTITNVLSIAFCISCFLYIYLRKEFRFDCFIVPLILFCVYSLVSWIITQYSFATAKSTLTLYILVFFLYEFIKNVHCLSKFFVFYVLGGVILAALLFISNFRAIISLDFGRLGSEFGNLNDIGLVFSYCGILCFFLSFFKKKIAWVYLILYFLFLGFVFLTGSRAALLSFFTSSFVFLMFFLRGKKKVLLLIFISILVAASLLILNLPTFAILKDRLIGAVISLLTGGHSGDGSADERFMMIKEGLYLWLQSPIFGHGLEAFRFITNFHVYAHASIADILCNLGVFGLLLWIFPILFSLVKSKNENRLFVLIIFIGIFVPGLFLAILSTSKFFMIIYVFTIAYVSLDFEPSCFISLKSSSMIPKLSIVITSDSIFSRSKGR